MPVNRLKEILELMLNIERAAIEVYGAISEVTVVDEQKAFWRDISFDEKRHFSYWEQLLAQLEKGLLQNPFDDSTKVKAELESMKFKIDVMLANKNTFSDISTAMLFALRLESTMMHPAFHILFRVLKTEVGDQSPEDDYREHIDKFSQFVKKYVKKPEWALVSEILSQMWEHNTELANQFVEVNTLRGIIPICASCKDVRDDEGYWSQIESYLAKHSEAKFTHGICPKCAKKLYPDIDSKQYRQH